MYNNKIGVIGDLHLTDKDPYWLEISKYRVKSIIDSVYNNDTNTLILLGDLLDKALINSEIVDLLLYLFENLKYKNIYIIHGNHTYYYHKERDIDISTIKILKNRFDNIKIIENKEEAFTIEGIKFLGLPHLKSRMIEGKTMKQYYEDLPEDIKKDYYDFIVGHIADKTNTTFGHFSDISYLNYGKIVLGHIHIKNGNSLGSYDINSRTEKEKDSYIGIIDIESKEYSEEKLERITDYFSITYDISLEDLKSESRFKETKFPILDIYSTPTKIEALEKFKDFYIGEVYLKEYDTLLKEAEKEIEITDIKELFEKAIVNIENTDVRAYVKGLSI